MKKIILRIPHASTKIADKEAYPINEVELQQEILKLNDRVTD